MSILDETYTDNDIELVNWGIKHFAERGEGSLTPHVARLLVGFHDGVPQERRHELTWHPSESLRRLAQTDLSRTLITVTARESHPAASFPDLAAPHSTFVRRSPEASGT